MVFRGLEAGRDLSVADLTEIPASLVYRDHPIGQALVDQIRITAEDLELV